MRLPDAPMPASRQRSRKVPVPCDRCHGTGINAGIECSECGGKGHRVVIGGKMTAPTKPPEWRSGGEGSQLTAGRSRWVAEAQGVERSGLAVHNLPGEREDVRRKGKLRQITEVILALRTSSA